jgi:NAD(P)H-flavin reductase
MLKHQLDDRVARYPDQIKIHYMLDRVETGSNWKGGVGFVTPAVLAEHLRTLLWYVCVRFLGDLFQY